MYLRVRRKVLGEPGRGKQTESQSSEYGSMDEAARTYYSVHLDAAGFIAAFSFEPRCQGASGVA
jgi:hypothetical protein